MKTGVVGGLLIGTGLALGSAEAMAQNSVDFQGRRYTCENRCVITVNGNNWRITDSMGGKVTWRILPTYPHCDYDDCYRP